LRSRNALACAALGIGLLLAGPPALCEPLEEPPPPRIQPGHVPEPESKDERGLWMEMADFEKQLAASPMLVRDPEINNFVRDVFCRVAGDYCHDVRIYIVRNPGFNASMAPNGTMVIWTGVFTRVRDEDELAVILGHELAHFLRTHSLLAWRKAKREMAAGSILSLAVGIATGVLLPVGESLALLSSLSFSREQEREADLLGTRLLVDGGFDPNAAYQVWEFLVDEESHAVAKSEDPGVFSKTHPEPLERAQELRRYVGERYGPPADRAAAEADYLAGLGRHYEMLMEDQLDTNRFGRTEFLLDRHAAMGLDPGLVDYYRGEMYRQRGGGGDAESARQAYLRSIGRDPPYPPAFRNLGYLALKAGDRDSARGYFEQYLALAPEADDREMIKFYLEDPP
jgi:predicted Zn-dependent protease